MKKPLEMTPQGFAELIRAELRNPAFRSTGSGRQKVAAEKAGVSPAVIGLMVKGKFPEQPRAEGPDHVFEKRVAGAVFSLTRVCDLFGFDLDACLEACGLPNLPYVIQESRDQRQPLYFDGNDLKMLLQQTEVLGSIPIKLARTLVRRFREKDKNETG